MRDYGNGDRQIGKGRCENGEYSSIWVDAIELIIHNNFEVRRVCVLEVEARLSRDKAGFLDSLFVGASFILII